LVGGTDMKKIIISMAAAVLAMTACVKEQAPANAFQDENLVTVEFAATSDVDTKTALVPGGNNKTAVVWEAGDKISVWDGTANREFTIKSFDGSSAVFTGKVSADATSFYAIYPYTAILEVGEPDDDTRDIRFRFPTTEIEYARPGNLPKGRGIAVAVAAEGKFAFQNRTALIKFSLAEDMNDVKSVIIQGNEANDYLWGTVNLEFKGTSVFQGIAYGYDRGTSVTLCNEDGSNLQTGVDYYIAIPGNQFAAGFNVTIKYADGTAVTKTSDKAIQPYTKDIIPLASTPLTKDMFKSEEGGGEESDPATSYYAAYMAGQDIMIAGKAYNKSVYGDGTLVKTGETVDLTSGGKVYFVEPGAVSKIGPTNSATKYIVIGDDPTQRTSVTQDAAIKVGKDNAHYAFFNLDFNSTIAETSSGSTNDLITIANAGSTIERIAYDNCHIELTGRYNIYNSNSTFKDIAYHNCDFVMTVTGHDVSLIKCDSSTSADYQSIDLQNNLFWHSSAFSSANFAFNIVLAVNTNAIDNIVMKNNTFINLRTRFSNSYYFQINNSGSYTSGGNTYECEGVVDSAVIEGNIIYIDDDNLSGNWSLLRANATTGTVSNNYAYYAKETNYKFYFGGKIADSSKSMTTLTSSPFSSLTIDAVNRTCDVTVVDAYKNYGAKR